MAKFCVKCGKELEENQAFCANCGTKVDGEAEEKTTVISGSDVVGEKSRIAAGLLGIFLGALGIHNFYLGYTGKGVAQLLISVLSCGVLSVVSGVWALIEAIMIFTDKSYKDAQGMLLQD